MRFAVYWVALGIASSVGFGTGLHTFVLYLGPWIAKFTMAVNECNAIPQMLPNKWTFTHFAKCSQNSQHEVPLYLIYLHVFFEAFLWGLGTAIGELPPYLVARFGNPEDDE